MTRQPAERPTLARVWPDAAAGAALVLLVLAFFWKMAFTDLILPRGDAFTYFYPYWAARNAALSAGRLPLWNPDLFMGVPFLANSQAGVLYPPNWALIALDAPAAVKAAAVTHVIWAAIGAYIFARWALHQSVLGATLTGAAFALGGYLTAQVEHINQLQGLAWLPWLLWLFAGVLDGRWRFVLLMGLAFAMQLLAGHTQTAFISGVALGVWALWETFGRWRRGERNRRALIWPLGAVALAALIAAGLAAPQLLPTMELTAHSYRSNGLRFREALTFSLPLPLVGRALLPTYAADPPFSEYVAYIGVAGLMLALVGVWLARRDWRVLGLAALAGLGLFFALGAYNPVYWVLVRFVPGFDLFRAPARWLVLTALGAAGLAGAGLDGLAGLQTRPRRAALLLAGPALIVVLLAGLSFLAPLAGDDVQGATAPGATMLAGWAAALGLALAGIGWLARGTRAARRTAPPLLAALVVVELFLAGRALPYNDLSAPQAWSSARPSISTLQAATAGETPPARFLSLSEIFFDPGDLRELRALYDPLLGEEATYDLVIATKLKEIVAPNLSMAWGLPSMDGFDGGVLPTRDYIRYTSLFLGDEVAVDGRLREYLEGVPPLEWLRLANVRYILTDKVADAWVEDVYYDLTFPQTLGAGDVVTARPAQPFVATAAGVVLSGGTDSPPGTPIGEVVAVTPGRERVTAPLVAGSPGETLADGRVVVQVEWGEALLVERVELALDSTAPGEVVAAGVSLIDTRSGAFLPATLSSEGTVRLLHSGDVKIYEDVGALPRAYVTCDVAAAASVDEAFERLAQNPAQTVVVGGESLPACPGAAGRATIHRYEPERIELAVDVEVERAYLILTDQWYPGWRITVDGESADVLRANGLFRAVPVTRGRHTVVFTYHSRPLAVGAAVSAATSLGIAAALVLTRLRQRTHG
ncbi:MAG TPA: YfhO family protein [Aggregatilineales bacterium]|nr:YfhO family protein [Aggregatilineales bacterium]